MVNKDSLFSDIPDSLPEELFTTILKTKGVSIERIVSDGHSSDSNFWYNQERDEFVLVIQGSGTIQFENQESHVSLEVGEYLFIPSHTRHRVTSTATDQKTIWLAVHI